MKRIFIIGNAPNQEPISDIFSKQDIVVRFNHPTSECLERYGSRTDILFTINTWKFILKCIQINLLEDAWLNQCKEIVLPYHPSILQNYHRQPSWFSAFFKGKKIDGSNEALAYFGQQFPVKFLSRSFYLDCCSLLNIQENELKDKVPSTGFLAIIHYLKTCPDAQIYIHGFSWEGWEGHEWDAEKDIMKRLLNEQKISWAKDLLAISI